MNIPSFTQVAGNLANMGYYPTTEADCRAIATQITGYSYTMLDPCCGAGDALKTITANMQGYGEAMGIEIEEGRAEEAKNNLSAVVHKFGHVFSAMRLMEKMPLSPCLSF